MTADFTTALATLQRCGCTGGSPTSHELRNLLACIREHQDSVTASRAAIAAADAAIATQTAALTVIGGASEAAGDLIITAMATLVAAEPAAFAPVANDVIDGTDA